MPSPIETVLCRSSYDDINSPLFLILKTTGEHYTYHLYTCALELFLFFRIAKLYGRVIEVINGDVYSN